MKEGLLWYDNDPGRDLAEKISQAAKRYRKKFGASPNVCYVHPSAIGSLGQSDSAETQESRTRKVGNIQVASLPSVLRHHFWLGYEGAGQ